MELTKAVKEPLTETIKVFKGDLLILFTDKRLYRPEKYIGQQI